MKVDGSRKWYYDKGEWKGKKLTPTDGILLLYRRAGNYIYVSETRDTISAGDSITYTILFNTI
jgi:hypothetical protein